MKGLVLIPGQETKFPQVARLGQKKKKKARLENYSYKGKGTQLTYITRPVSQWGKKKKWETKEWNSYTIDELQVAYKNMWQNKLQGTHTKSIIDLADSRAKKKSTGNHLIS